MSACYCASAKLGVGGVAARESAKEGSSEHQRATNASAPAGVVLSLFAGEGAAGKKNLKLKKRLQ